MDSRQLSLTRNASEATLLPLSEVEAKEKDVKMLVLPTFFRPKNPPTETGRCFKRAVQQAVIQKKQEEILTQMELNVLRSAMISIGGPTQFKGVPVSERVRDSRN